MSEIVLLNFRKSIRSLLMAIRLMMLCWLIAYSYGALSFELTPTEQTYLQTRGTVSVCVDPDWSPFEVIDIQGKHLGISADLLALVAKRTGLSISLLKTHDWPESLAASKSGRCQLLSLLNETPARSEWLIFTQPILTDENVLITREEHPFIGDLAGIQNHTMALPKGTSIEERIRRDFPNIKLIITDTEAQTFAMVSERKADMTMRSLIVAAYTIKHEGWFNLKIAGQVPGYGNRLCIGVVKAEPLLRDILNKGVSSITPVERQQIVDRHIIINATTSVDYSLVGKLIAVFGLILLTSLFWLRKLKQAKDIAEQTATQQRQFIAMLSHEVRTPLAVIDATTQVLWLRLSDDVDKLPLVSRIRRGAARLSNFFDNCLTTDRIDSQSFAVKPEPVDVPALVQWAKENAELLSPEHSIQIDIEPDMPTLQGDQTLLRILLINLLSNSAKYSHTKEPITLRAFRNTQNPNLCRFVIEDKGQGIPEDEIEIIFHKYQRGRAAQGQPGAGLGLALVMRIATLHRGTVNVESHIGHGTRLTVEIPFDAH